MPQMRVSQKALNQRIRYRDQFTEFARDCLTIRVKAGSLAPLELNRAQLHIHECVERQKAETGKVRAIILKGRQQGCSTYVEGRFYWLTVHRKGVRTFILAHDKSSTSTIYEMANRYHDNCPATIRPHTGTSNARELDFDILDSGYRIGTAGTDTVGRGTTLQHFHGSEVAFWPARSEGEISKGVLQAVPDMPDTEIILESTANGIGGFYHGEVQKALRGEGDYILIFTPWYWQEEYRRPQPIDFQPDEEEEKLMAGIGTVDGYKLDAEQICWRRAKIVELTTPVQDGNKAFRQEYPNTINDAFLDTGKGGMFDVDDIRRARKAEGVPRGTIKVVGVDPNGGGSARFSVARRQGRVLYGVESHTDVKTLGQKVQICKKILDKEEPDKMFIDYGYGGDLVDRLHELGYDNVRAIKFGGDALDPEKYRNKRCEMWGEMLEWIEDETMAVSIPDSDTLEADLLGPKSWLDSKDRLCMESKEDMQKRGVPSPDEGDAAALTFAEPVRRRKPRKLNYKRKGIV